MADGSLSLDVEAGSLAAAATKGRRWVECMVFTVGLATSCMSAASVMYKALAGIFVGHSCVSESYRAPLRPVRFVPDPGVHGGPRRSPHTRQVGRTDGLLPMPVCKHVRVRPSWLELHACNYRSTVHHSAAVCFFRNGYMCMRA